MKLDRNINKDGKGKYALILLRDVENWKTPEELADAIKTNPKIVDYGFRHHESEFFVIRLKDKHAEAALMAYANSIADEDEQFAGQIVAMAQRAASHPNKKKPD